MGRKHLALGLVVLLFILTLAPGAAGAVQRTYEVTSEAQFLEAINEINALDEGTYEVVIKSDITVKKEVALEKSTVSLLGENTRLTFGAGGALLVRGAAELRLGAASGSVSLTIDSTDNTRAIIAVLDSARLAMYDGVTLGPSKSGGNAAGVQLQDQSKFYMYGGTITDCENWASVAGGVLVSEDTEFVLYDGVIQNCQGYQGGAVGVIERGKFTMMDGKIIDCLDHWYGGGAVNVFGTQASFTMQGGEISGCAADYYGYGGAVFVYSTQGGATLQGGSIHGNSTVGYGGGLFVYDGSVSVAGNVALYDNLASLAGDDVFLNSGTLTLGAVPTGLQLSACGHAIDGWYRDGNEDGDLRWNQPADVNGDGVVDYDGNGINDLDANGGLDLDGDGTADLAAGDAYFEPFAVQGGLTAPLALKAAHHRQVRLTFVSNGGTEYPDAFYSLGQVVPLEHKPEKPGYHFTGWYSEAACLNRLTHVLMDGDQTVYAGWRQIETPEEPTTPEEPIPETGDARLTLLWAGLALLAAAAIAICHREMRPRTSRQSIGKP